MHSTEIGSLAPLYKTLSLLTYLLTYKDIGRDIPADASFTHDTTKGPGHTSRPVNVGSCLLSFLTADNFGRH